MHKTDMSPEARALRALVAARAEVNRARDAAPALVSADLTVALDADIGRASVALSARHEARDLERGRQKYERKKRREAELAAAPEMAAARLRMDRVAGPVLSAWQMNRLADTLF